MKTYELTLLLCNRETEILALILNEYTTPEIADKLFVSTKTIKSHRCNLMKKMKARNTAGLVRRAFENNFVALK